MFSGLPDPEKEAFFSLLDQYFEARPYLLPAGDPRTAPPASTTGSNLGLSSSNREDLQRAGRFAATPVGQKVAGMAAGRALGNKALGNAAASMWAGHHQAQQSVAASATSPSGSSAGGAVGASSAPLPPPVRRAPPPAAPSSASKPQGINGLVSGRSIGSLQLGSKTTSSGSIASRQTPPTSRMASATSTAARPSSGSGTVPQPPPARSAPGVVPRAAPTSSPAAAMTGAETATALDGDNGGIGTAEALYDYGDALDPDDLVVVEGERIVLLEKISDDWWRARKASDSGQVGIVPTSYVRQL
ncbi:hypothetical protein ACQY0O_005307 [Thecaphora frezii]